MVGSRAARRASGRGHRPVSEELSPNTRASNRAYWEQLSGGTDAGVEEVLAAGDAEVEEVGGGSDAEVVEVGEAEEVDYDADTANAATAGHRSSRGSSDSEIDGDADSEAEGDGDADSQAGSDGDAESMATALASDAGDAKPPLTTEEFVLKFPENPLQPKCNKCLGAVDPLRCRLGGKALGSWTCNSCSTKSTQLRRLFGTWPPKCFQLLPENHKAEFWKDCEGMDGGPRLERLVVSTLVKSRIESEESSIGGEYLPLSVYKARGYDTDVIEAKCTDTDVHPVLGKCYRVQIRAVFTKTVEQLVRKELLDGKKRFASGADEIVPVTNKTEKKARKKRARSSSSSSSSASSAPSSPTSPPKKAKKGKKGKKTKTAKKGKRSKRAADSTDSEQKKKKDDKEQAQRLAKAEREREKLHKEREAKEAKDAKDNYKLAARVLGKVAPLHVSLANDLKDPMAKHVPTFASVPAKKALDTLSNYQKTATEGVATRGKCAKLPWSAAEVDEACKEGTAAAGLFAKLLATARAHSSR